MYDYETLTVNEKLRYGEFWADRYDYMCQQMPPLRLYAWHERVVVRPTTTTVLRKTDGGLMNASVAGTPFVGARKRGEEVDIYYKFRFPWKRWQMKSIRCVAKRVWNAEVREL